MPWARFDDNYPNNRKVRPLSDAAYRLDSSAICWSNANLTDGFVRDDELEVVSDVKKPRPAVEELVLRGRWDKTEAGWQIHDFLDYNPSREQVLAERAKAAERQRKAREAARAKREAARDAALDLDLDLGHGSSHASSSPGVTP